MNLKERIVNISKELDKIEKEYGYMDLELAFIINAMAQNSVEDIEEWRIKKAKNFVDGLDEIFDEYVKQTVYDMVNDEEEEV